jgi:HlyD family secretion protein
MIGRFWLRIFHFFRNQSVGVWLVLGMFALYLTACGTETNAQPTPVLTPDAGTTSSPITDSITANGVLLPAQQVELSFGAGGFVESILVEVGENVQAGQTLARLDSTEAEWAVRQAEATLMTSQAHLDLLLGGATAAEIATAEADVIIAEIALEEAQQTYYLIRERAVRRAEATLIAAQAQLDLLMGGATAEEITITEAGVIIAEIALEEALTYLGRGTLSAPFKGVVSAVYASTGEWATPGETVIVLLDLSRWRIETKNVGELQIGRVEIGEEACVRVNAFQNETLTGYVVAIYPIAAVQQGDTTYTLVIELEPTDLDLLPGMTAQVEIFLDGEP